MSYAAGLFLLGSAATTAMGPGAAFLFGIITAVGTAPLSNPCDAKP